jgi:hypothetical protein
MIQLRRDIGRFPLFEAYMLATVRSVDECESFNASQCEAPLGTSGFVSFVSPPFDFTRAFRFQAVLPVSAQHAEPRRNALDLDEDFRDLLADNPALLTGLLPPDSPRWLTSRCELGSDNYIG